MSTARPQDPSTYLLLRVERWHCALEVRDVEEVMRPLPVWNVADAPRGVRGLSRIRGEVVPVLQLWELLGVVAPTRYWVTTRQRPVALGVEAVLGLYALPNRAQFPPLLSDASDALSHLCVRDANLCCVLEAARLIDPKRYDALVASGDGQ